MPRSRRRPPTLLAVLAVLGSVAACTGSEGSEAVGTTTTTIEQISEVGRRRPWDGMVLPPDAGEGYRLPGTVEELAALAALGAPNVAVVVPLVQDATDPEPRPAVTTPVDVALDGVAAAAGELGLGLVVEVRLDVADGDVPEPADPARWFEAYTERAVEAAELAEEHDASLLVIGGEVGALVDERRRWEAVIAEVGASYDGPVAFTTGAGSVDQVAFWDVVDVIGVEAEFPDPDVPEPIAADIEKAWEPVLAELSLLAETWDRPVVLTRVGYPGVARGEGELGVGEERQLGAYEALFTVINQTPAVEGVLVWRWGTDPGGAPAEDATYSPEGRPAEEVLRRAWTTPLADDEAEPGGDPDGGGDAGGDREGGGGGDRGGADGAGGVQPSVTARS